MTHPSNRSALGSGIAGGRRLSKALDWISLGSLMGSLSVILLLLAGCSHMPLGSMVKLARIDPMATNPAHLRVAVRGPDFLRIAPKKAIMKVGATVKHKPQEKVDESFVLLEMPPSSLPAELENEMAGSEHVALFRINPQDLPRLARTQDMVRKLKAWDGKQVEGFLTMDVTGCRQTQHPVKANRARVTIYLKTAPAERFYPLIRDYDLAKVTGRSYLSELPRCMGKKTREARSTLVSANKCKYLFTRACES